jgi:hypothetical protein
MNKKLFVIIALMLFLFTGIFTSISSASNVNNSKPGLSCVILIRTVTDRPGLNLIKKPFRPLKVSVSPTKNVDSVRITNTGAQVVLRYDFWWQALFGYVSVTIKPPRNLFPAGYDYSITKQIRAGILFDFIPTTYHWPRA